MSVKKRGLGRGLDALLGSVSSSANDPPEELRELALDNLSPGRHQPRRNFEPEALQSLADSIRAQGVVQPIVAREAGGGRYEIVAGERRWRAARMAGLTTIPAVVRQMPDQAAMAIALVENIQRADLNALEEAEALKRLIDEVGLTHEQTAEAVGRSRAAVSNLLRLMDLDRDVQGLLRDNKLSLGHAKVLLALPTERQLPLARQIIEQQLSVRDTERLIEHQPKKEPQRSRPQPAEQDAALTARLGLPVQLKKNSSGRGRIIVSFKSQAELDRLLARLG